MTAKDILKITLNLVVVYLVGGFLLAGVYAKTSPIMFKNAVIEKDRALKKMLPEADKVSKIGAWKSHDKDAEYYEAKKGEQIIGYIIQSFGKGYSSYINVLIAVDPNLKVLKIDILSHAETPGLGDEIETPEFKGQFVGKGLEQMKILKTETKENIQAITGVTISSRAVTEDAVKNGLAQIAKVVKGGAQ